MRLAVSRRHSSYSPTFHNCSNSTQYQRCVRAPRELLWKAGLYCGVGPKLYQCLHGILRLFLAASTHEITPCLANFDTSLRAGNHWRQDSVTHACFWCRQKWATLWGKAFALCNFTSYTYVVYIQVEPLFSARTSSSLNQNQIVTNGFNSRPQQYIIT